MSTRDFLLLIPTKPRSASQATNFHVHLAVNSDLHVWRRQTPSDVFHSGDAWCRQR